MFTNAGMNQFKDIFLGNSPATARVVNSQKCMRVSGKHNDLEEVGVDTYHHTMFEMLGNWSFGDYFKTEAIAWSWEYLTDVLQLPKDRLYATVFEGDAKEGLPPAEIALREWRKILPDSHIIYGNKKDNFWEMGDTGPCGPCSEIHIDLRSETERSLIPGKDLVNKDHPQVIEIWNNVFIQFNRKADGTLEPLPAKHVDTGMGLERLVRAVQNKSSNYDTDIFMPIIDEISRLTRITYGDNPKTDIAMRVLADHIRAIVFTIQDGQMPSNTGAGYVIRRILRRAVRYAFSYLHYKQPILFQLVSIVIGQFEGLYPELRTNQTFLENVIREEEQSFLRTLDAGLGRLNKLEEQMQTQQQQQIEGKVVFELYDTYGFPRDLTRLIAQEKGLGIDEDGFMVAMNEQKERARQAAKIEAGDWIIQNPDYQNSTFIGYDMLEVTTEIIKYRKVKQKGKTQYQIVLAETPFYAESGGQVGDTGTITFGTQSIKVIDTKKENNLIVHYTTSLPDDLNANCLAKVDAEKRHAISTNHTATHLLHAALRQVLGKHVEQKGSLVNADYLRFDFSHFAKITDEEIAQVEAIVNARIRQNIMFQEYRQMPIEKAKAMGAMALFGEKYGNEVRVVIFDPSFSIELCGGTHLKATGEIGFCKITAESASAAGVRRIEALTALPAFQYLSQEAHQLKSVKQLLKNPRELVKSVEQVLDENSQLRKELERVKLEEAGRLKNQLKAQIQTLPNGVRLLTANIKVDSADLVKKIAFDLRNETEDLVAILGANLNGKAHLSVMVSDSLKSRFDAIQIIKKISGHIKGGGGGQNFFATAGGQQPEGIAAALQEAHELITQ